MGEAAVGIKTRVENGDLEPAGAAGAEESAEYLRGFVPCEAAGVPVVDGSHQLVVENIDVEMHPEPLGTWAGDRASALSRALAAPRSRTSG
jgi:hypothetical protein